MLSTSLHIPKQGTIYRLYSNGQKNTKQVFKPGVLNFVPKKSDQQSVWQLLTGD